MKYRIVDKKRFALFLLTVTVFLLLSFQVAFGQRLNLPAKLWKSVKQFLSLNPSLSAADYQDGTIILVKPIPTGEGEGRYEAGDIVEIRDGAELYEKFQNGNFLGQEERTQLLPLYYPGKLTPEQKQEILSSVENSIVEEDSVSESAVTKEEDSGSESAVTRETQKITKRRQSGIDYTQFLSDREILKIREGQPLKGLPEINLDEVLKKKDPFTQSVVQLSSRILAYEKTKNTLNKIAKSLIPTALAVDPTRSEKIVDPGNGPGTDYLSLNAWEAAQQADLVSTNVVAIAKCRATNGTADTTAVYIYGWTTDASHYVKVWTDPNESFRHSGKWDNNKYNLSVTNPDHGVLTVYIKNAVVDGLQVTLVRSSGGLGMSGIYVQPNNNTELDVKISNNIVRGQITGGSDYSYGIQYEVGTSVTGKSYVWNNIIYDFNYNSGGGIICRAGNSKIIYNNTIYNNITGINLYDGSSDVILKNNLVYNNTDNYSGTFDSSSTNNLSGPGTDANIPPTNKRDGVAVTFADATNKDFHLTTADTGAKGYGANLGSDPQIQVTTDIDGQERPAQGAFDIGADQVISTPIYRSVGPGNTTALATGTSNALSLSGSEAVFTTDLPDRVGVGDVLQYDSDNNGSIDSLAFIHGRTDATHFTVKNVNGQVPAKTNSADSDWSLFRAYTSLYNAERGVENTGINATYRNFDDWTAGGDATTDDVGKDLSLANQVWNIACYGDAVDSVASVSVDGWTTAAADYIRIYTPVTKDEVGVSQRHQGKWDNAKYRLETGGHSIDDHEDFVRIDGLQIKNTNSGDGYYAIRVYSLNDPSALKISNNIIWGVLSGSASANSGIATTGSANYTVYIWNNIIYDFINGSGGMGIRLNNGGTQFIYNNTITDCAGGINRNSGIAYLKNNASYNNTDNYVGSFSTSTNNLSGPSQSDAPGSNPRNAVTVTFEDPTNKDFHLKSSDVGAKGYGANLSADSNLAVTDDIDGETRSSEGSTPFDIGADEITVTQVNSPISGRYLDGLVGYWSFDGQDTNWTSATTGTTADLSGNGNTGTLTNMSRSSSPTPGINGQGFNFDATNDYINLGTGAGADGFTQLTVSAWYRSDIANTSDQCIISQHRSGFHGWEIYRGSDERFGVEIDTVNNYGVHAVSDTSFQDTNWHHIVGTYDGTQVQVYVDNIARDSSPPSATGEVEVDTGNLREVCIGKQTGGGNICSEATTSTLNGTLDDVRIYNRALSSDEITELYKAGSARMVVNSAPSTPAGLQSGLVGHWTFNGPDTNWTSATTGTTNDLSGSGITGTLTNISRSGTPTPGKEGQGFNFDGSDDRIQTAMTSFITFQNQPHSVFAWVYPNNVSATQGIWSFGEYDDVAANTSLGISSNHIGWLTNGTAYFWDSGLTINTNQWSFIGFVRTATNIKFFLNGSNATVNSTLGNYIGGTDPLLIGCTARNAALEGFFNGRIDDVHIYNRTLSDVEVEQLYNLGNRKVQIRPN